jgi:hypothetical protein
VNAYAPPDAAVWRVRKIRLVAVLYALTVATGAVRGELAPSHSAALGINLLWWIAVAAAAVFWCDWDGRERRTGRRVAIGWIVLLSVFAVAVHLLRTRGRRGGTVATLVAFAVFVGLMLTFEAGAWLTRTAAP